MSSLTCSAAQVGCFAPLTQTLTTFLPRAVRTTVRTTIMQATVSDHTSQCSQCFGEWLYSEETLPPFARRAFLKENTSLKSLSNKARLSIFTDSEWRLSAPWTAYHKQKETLRTQLLGLYAARHPTQTYSSGTK